MDAIVDLISPFTYDLCCGKLDSSVMSYSKRLAVLYFVGRMGFGDNASREGTEPVLPYHILSFPRSKFHKKSFHLLHFFACGYVSTSKVESVNKGFNGENTIHNATLTVDKRVL